MPLLPSSDLALIRQDLYFRVSIMCAHQGVITDSVHEVHFISIFSSVPNLCLQALRWHDARDTDFSGLDLEACCALILNVKSSSFLAPLLGSRHWIGLRRFCGIW